MPGLRDLSLPASPARAKFVTDQVAMGGVLINIYEYRGAYCAFADGIAYQVPSAADDVLTISTLSSSGREWLLDTVIRQRYRVHAMLNPDPTELSALSLLSKLGEEEELNFDLEWDTFRKMVESRLFHGNLAAVAPIWHRAFCEQWLAIQAELEARR